MKKIISAVLVAAMLMSVAGCSRNVDSSQNTDEPTGKIVIYIPPNLEISNYIKTAYRAMERKNPDIEFEVHDYSSDRGDPEAIAAYYEMLKQELSTGGGPDIIIDDQRNLNDIYKMMDSGTFYNIDKFLLYDENYDPALYNLPVLDAGVYRGERLCVPLCYQLLVMATGAESAERAGFPLSGAENVSAFLQAAAAYNERIDPEKDALLFASSDAADSLLRYSGLQFVDYQQGTVNVDSGDFKLYMQLYKALLSVDEFGRIDLSAINGSRPIESYLFMSSNQLFAKAAFVSSLLGSAQTPAVLTMKTPENETVATVDVIAAIPAASNNKVNAYRLIQYALSESVQQNRLLGTPVNLVAAAGVLDNSWVRRNRARLGSFSDRWVVEATPYEAVKEIRLQMQAIDRAILTQHSAIDHFIIPEMQPYLTGKESYETCLRRLRNKLAIYVRE